MEHIVSGHREATVERCRGQPVVLAIQDTTALNYGGGGAGKTLGVVAHVGLAITESRRPLGVVTVCDREADMWSMLSTARRNGRKLLVRLSEVELLAPRGRADDSALRLLAVRATETGAPPDTEPLDWVLLSTEGGTDRESALRLLRWYEARWTIEEYFRILKVGTRVEDHRPDHAADLRKCLAFDAITAWRVMDLQRLARDKPATELFSQHDIQVLHVLLRYYHVIRAPPDAPPDIRTLVVDLARLVGFIPSRRQPLPGTQKLWEGWRKYSISLHAINAHIKISEGRTPMTASHAWHIDRGGQLSKTGVIRTCSNVLFPPSRGFHS